MDAAYDWLNLATALFLGKAGGIAGVLAIFGMIVAVGVAFAQYEGFGRSVGIAIVLVSIAATAWILARPDHYRVPGQYGFSIDVPVSFAIVDWSDGRITLAGGPSGNDRMMFRTGSVPYGESAALLNKRHQRWQQFAQRRGGKISSDITGAGFAFVTWAEQDQPDQPGATTHVSGMVMRSDGGDVRWASMSVTGQARGGRNRDAMRMRQSLCASAGLDTKVCARRS